MSFEQAPLIERLELDALPAGRHPCRFAPLPMASGQSWQIPLLILKGGQPGPRLWVVAGTHGDELNGIVAAQQLGREIDADALSGSLVILPGLNLPGIQGHTRDFLPADPDSSPANLNRLFPGRADGNSAERYVDAIWRHLLQGNADRVLDLHTQTRGAAYPLYLFADCRIKEAIAMARTFGADALLNDPGDKGVLETELNRAGIPTITVEVGSGKRLQPALIQRTVEGLQRVMVSLKMLSPRPLPAPQTPVEGNSTTTIRAECGGMALPQVALGQQVQAGALLAIQYDAFGAECRRYHAPKEGYVLSLNEDPLREPGSLLVRLLH
ncbi:succinylglutamate desuccinylase/aspartoacylase family protein [Ferrimonas gelatinilytica]|uniref:Succinylglutamate desuccinylase/aspartoacylase family protein n=1 Tax=Ferrimonas gelatinilytica TaxID=1255257 RepID=A0ABP9S634_9GAMM